MFALKWHQGQENLAEYQSKHHVGSHHIAVRPWYLYTENSPRYLPREPRASTLKECVGTLQNGYIRNVPLPRVAQDGDDHKSVVNDLYSPVPPATSKSAGVSLVEEGSTDMIPGVDSPAIVDIASEPTGVDMGAPQADPLKAALCLMMLSLIWHWMMVLKHMT